MKTWMTTAVVVALFAGMARAEEPVVDTARQVFEKHQNCVVWVTAVMKMRAGGALGGMFGKQEQKVDAVGTIIDESGLTVLSYTMLDPSAMLNAAMAGMGGGGVGEEKVEFKSELGGVKIRLADGSEIPAKLVLKDDDLDLAFVMPTEKGKKLPFLKLNPKPDAAKVKALDPVIGISRLPQALDRQAAVSIARVAAVVTKPRTFYVCTGDVEAGIGAPTFRGDGSPLGILVIRKQSMDSGMRGMFGIGNSGGIAVVVVPAANVMEVAQQALAKKDDAPAPAAKEQPAAKENSPAKDGKP